MDGCLAQLELEGAELHGLQADGRVVGQRGAGVHEGERDGLQQLHLQVPEEPRDAQLRETQRDRHRLRFFVFFAFLFLR